MTWDLKNLLNALASATVLGAITVFFGRVWTQSYYRVLGVPTGDLDFNTVDYALQAREALMMLVPAALVAGLLSIPKLRRAGAPPARRRWEWPGPGAATSRWAALRRSARRALPTLAPLLLGVAGFVLWMLVMRNKYSTARAIVDLPLWAIDLWGGVSLGAAIGGAIALVITDNTLRRVLWVVVLALLLAAPITMTTELAELQAVRDIRDRALPQAVIEFREMAPAVIRRADDPTRSDVVHVVLATKTRVAVAFPFGCRSLRGGSALADVQGAPPDEEAPPAPADNETCDTFTFDRQDIRSMRIFGGDASRPFNDEAERPLPITLAPATPLVDESFDLTVARKDACGPERLENVRGVWLQVRAAEQYGRVVFEQRPEELYLAADPARQGRSQPSAFRCTKIARGESLRLLKDEVALLLVATKGGGSDRVIEQLRLRFLPLEFSPQDVYVGALKPGPVRRGQDPTTAQPALPAGVAVRDRSSISVVVDLSGAPEGVPRPTCEEPIRLSRAAIARTAPAGPAAAANSAPHGGGDVAAPIDLRPTDCRDEVLAGATTMNYTAGDLTQSGDWELTLPGTLEFYPLTVAVTPKLARLAGLTVSPAAVLAGDAALATVSLDGPAPVDGVTVQLSASSPEAVELPANVLIPGGQASGTVTVRARPIGKGEPGRVTVGASLDDISHEASLEIRSPGAQIPVPTATPRQPPAAPPTRVIGTARLNDAQAPPGTPVTAMIGSAVCGTATVDQEGRFTLDVSSAVSRPGCGTEGAVITFTLGGGRASSTATWRQGALISLNLVARLGASPAPGVATPPSRPPTLVPRTPSATPPPPGP